MQFVVKPILWGAGVVLIIASGLLMLVFKVVEELLRIFPWAVNRGFDVAVLLKRAKLTVNRKFEELFDF